MDEDTARAAQMIVACSREAEIDNKTEWFERHRAQSGGDINVDETDIDGTDAVCAVYEPDVTLEIAATDDVYRETLADRLFAKSIAGVEVPVQIGCDRVFGEATELPIYDGNLAHVDTPGSPYQSAYTTICITPERMLQIQYNLHAVKYDDINDFEEWLPRLDSERIRIFREKLQADPADLDRPVPRPVLAFDHDGNLSTAQEGRHRAAAAADLGIPLIDVYAMMHHQVRTSEPEWAFPEPPEMPSKWG